ncbi:FKBP-type peptidyl-prolyl cis-trans isomerase [Rubrivirga sp. IMCC43871]|uniref:FKBP-type peptidyl-prolyl cis-trans isomerase n=1 Tax=Rubrivirga sp. IMCC43871 TaxID=3391575 RepID=UPI00398FA745
MIRLALLSLVLVLAACETEDPSTDAAGDGIATATSTVVVDYEGRLEDGTVFDGGEGVEFPLDRVVPGFQEGITGMRVGESKTIVMPPEMGYGAQGVPGVIPPNATLTFDVTLREILR